MAKLQLYFSHSVKPELFRIAFSHPLLSESRIVVRGKNINSSSRFGNFQWSEAVKGLAQIALAVAVDQSAQLVGGKGTAAASLDYALSKHPQWMCDLFGIDRQGHSIAKRVFTRVNAERKLPGPVTIAINPAQLASSDIEVYIEDRQLKVAEIKFLQERMGYQTQQADRQDQLKSILFPIYQAECRAMLSANYNFNHAHLVSKLKTMADNVSARRLSNSLDAVLNKLSEKFDINTRLGINAFASDLTFHSERPINFACTVVQGGMLALLAHIKEANIFPLKFNARFPYATSLVNSVIRDEYQPDFLSAGIAPALKLLSARSDIYQPFMLAPELSHRVVKTACADPVRDGDFLITAEEPNTSTFCFEALCDQNLIQAERDTLSHLEPDEIFCAFKDRDLSLRSLLWFPHYQLQSEINGATVVGPQDLAAYNQSILILVHKRMTTRPKLLRAFRIALADAWLELRDPTSLDLAIKNIFLQPNYLSDLRRYAGLI